MEKTITLRTPIVIGEGPSAITYDKFTLREPTAGEVEKASSATTSVGIMISLVSLIAKIPRKIAEQIPQTEFKEAADFLDSFSSSSPGTGATS